MHILLVSATLQEIEPTVNWLRARALSEKGNLLDFDRVQVEVMFTGIGMMAAAYALGRRFSPGSLPTLAIQAGVAGALDRSLQLGQVVRVTAETMGDLGAEAPDGTFLSLAEIGLPAGPPFDQDEILHAPPGVAALPFAEVRGLTVNQVTGSADSVAQIRQRFPTAQVESMEGAAFFYACLRAGVEPLQLRSISNYVEVRQRENWRLGEAVTSLNKALQQLLGAFIQ